MKIIKCDVKTYLTRYLSYTEEEIKNVNINNENELYDFINTESEEEKATQWFEPIFSYCFEELEDLIEREEEWKQESGNETFEDTYVLLFKRLWEVSNY